jgi:HJR/Mrr/RecB family endonuclease
MNVMEYNLLTFSAFLLFKIFYFNKSFLDIPKYQIKKTTILFTLEFVIYYHVFESIIKLYNLEFPFYNYFIFGISILLSLFGIKYLTIYTINILLNKLNLRRYNLFLKSSLEKELSEIDKLGNNGLDFEEYIAKLFRSMGLWAKTTTDLRKSGKLPTEIQNAPGSGEQGVDVIVYFNKKEKIDGEFFDGLIIQCKQYSNTVGNKVVQEIVTGAKVYEEFYNKKFKKVAVTNNYYSPSAKVVANTWDVHLIDRDNLPDLIKESCSTLREIKQIC